MLRVIGLTHPLKWAGVKRSCKSNRQSYMGKGLRAYSCTRITSQTSSLTTRRRVMSSATSPSQRPESQTSFPPKAYDAKAYQQLSHLLAVPTVSNIWAKPTTDETAPAEIMVTLTLHFSYHMKAQYLW
jgi:hypothetical protein